MSTWRIEPVPAAVITGAASCFARYCAILGIAVFFHYTTSREQIRQITLATLSSGAGMHSNDFSEPSRLKTADYVIVLRMGLLERFKKSDPTWLRPVQDFCRSNGIGIAAWGPKSLVVVAKSPEKSAEIAALLATFGFKPQENPNDAYAGLLTLSREES